MVLLIACSSIRPYPRIDAFAGILKGRRRRLTGSKKPWGSQSWLQAAFQAAGPAGKPAPLFHGPSRAEGPSQQTTRTDRLSHYQPACRAVRSTTFGPYFAATSRIFEALPSSTKVRLSVR